MSVKERLIDFIKHRDMSVRAFCRYVGVSETYVSSMRTSIQPDKLHNIIAHFPELNPLWLMTGEGNMLREDILPPIPKTELENHASDVFKDKLIDMFKNGEIYSATVVRDLQEQIIRLQSKISILENDLNECKKKHEVD